MPETENNDLNLILAAEVVAAYVSKNAIGTYKLPELIRDTVATINTLGDATDDEVPIDQKPAISIKKSVQNDHLVCLEDGQKYKSLKRHIRTSHGLTPEQYRQKWKLPADYPMVAPDYAERRSKLAKDLGLGRKAR